MGFEFGFSRIFTSYYWVFFSKAMYIFKPAFIISYAYIKLFLNKNMHRNNIIFKIILFIK